jgi:hypothetical protein
MTLARRLVRARDEVVGRMLQATSASTASSENTGIPQA